MHYFYRIFGTVHIEHEMFDEVGIAEFVVVPDVVFQLHLENVVFVQIQIVSSYKICNKFQNMALNYQAGEHLVAKRLYAILKYV